MIKNIFKEGDLVYAPICGVGIHKVKKGSNSFHPILITVQNSGIERESTDFTFSEKGKYNRGFYLPQLFHATKENQELLQKLYGVTFETPKPAGASLVKKLIDDGKNVLCSVWDHEHEKGKYIAIIIGYNECKNYFLDSTNVEWAHAVPINESGIEYVTGDVE